MFSPSSMISFGTPQSHHLSLPSRLHAELILREMRPRRHGRRRRGRASHRGDAGREMRTNACRGRRADSGCGRRPRAPPPSSAAPRPAICRPREGAWRRRTHGGAGGEVGDPGHSALGRAVLGPHMLAEALPKAWAAACQFRGHRDHGCRLAAATKKKRHRAGGSVGST